MERQMVRLYIILDGLRDFTTEEIDEALTSMESDDNTILMINLFGVDSL